MLATTGGGWPTRLQYVPVLELLEVSQVGRAGNVVTTYMCLFELVGRGMCSARTMCEGWVLELLEVAQVGRGIWGCEGARGTWIDYCGRAEGL